MQSFEHHQEMDRSELSSMLAVVRRELDQLVAERLLVPFQPGRQKRYEELCRLESELCQSRYAAH